MKRTVLLIICCLVLIGGARIHATPQIRRPVVAGSFYPAAADELSAQIDGFLERATPFSPEGRLVALISPHAGYRYSGPVAAYGYKLLSPGQYRTVVVLAPSHHVAFRGLSIYDQEGSFETPLGMIPVDTALARRLTASDPQASFDARPFLNNEHALEVQLPFLQKTLGSFSLVPVEMGDLTYADCERFAASLVSALHGRQDVLIVASTDLSHFYSYQTAQQIDARTIGTIERFAPRELFAGIANDDCQLCGGTAVVTALLAAQQLGASKVSVLTYANSGDTAGTYDRVVGYLSAAVTAVADVLPPAAGESDTTMVNKEEGMLTRSQKERLLQIARGTIRQFLADRTVLDVRETDPVLNRRGGAFVTLHQRGDLRGCIGRLEGTQPLYLTVRDMAVEAAVRDPRFAPLTAKELSSVDIEISVLSELRQVAGADEIVLGTHGVIVRGGFRSGVFLPQVATETGWSKEEFLSNLCAQKAGLAANAWKTGAAKLFVFTAEVFGEKERGTP